MRTVYRFASLLLLVCVVATTGFGWGNLTHVYLSKHLGVRFGNLNLNEMYGSVLPDMFNLVFTPEGQAIADVFHTNTDLMAGMYGSAVSPAARSAFYGFFTHNNVWGADYTAHENGMIVGDIGWVIYEAEKLAPSLMPYLTQVFIDAHADPATAEYIAGQLAPEMAHDLIEVGADVLLKEQLDPLVGARLYFAALHRSDEIPQVMAGVLASFGVPPQDVLDGEAEYRNAMMQYGQVFMLPRDQLVPTLGQLSADLAESYIAANTPFPNVVVSPEKATEYLLQAMAQVKRTYKFELFATLLKVKIELFRHGIVPAGPVLAAGGTGSIEEELGLLETAETSSTPLEFSLQQNYPNPFNPSTSISYTLPEDARVRLTVYNTLGQEIQTLVDDVEAAGTHVAVWNAAGAPSGVYLYRIEAGSFSATRRMTLLK